MSPIAKGFTATVLVVLVPFILASFVDKGFAPLVVIGGCIALLFPLLLPWKEYFLGSVFGLCALALLVILNFGLLDAARSSGLAGDDGGGGEAMAKVAYVFYFAVALCSVGLRVCGVAVFRAVKGTKEKQP